MDYLIPAWHDLPVDNAMTTPQMHFDDAISLFNLLKSADQQAGLIVTDYQPHLMTRLSDHAIVPTRIISIYDLLQGIHHYQTKALTYEDLQWPAGAYFEYSAFHLNVYVEQRLYARVIFDGNSRIIYIEQYHRDQTQQRLVFDSRGFVSRIEQYDDQHQEILRTYYDESGNWRFKHSLQDDAVDVNPLNNDLQLPLHYDHLQDCLLAVFKEQVAVKANPEDRFVVSLDDQAVIPQTEYLKLATIYYASSWHPTAQAYQHLRSLADFHCVFDTKDLANRLGAMQPTVISPLPTQFLLGHSQRQERQRILLFADDIDPNELMSLAEIIFQRLLTAKGDDELYLMSYTRQGLDIANQVIQMLQNNHDDEFQLFDPDDDDAKQELVDNDEKVSLVIKAQQCTANNDVLEILDKTRLLVDWGQKPDNYLRTTSVSVGIPRIQRVPTTEVVDHKNGLIVDDLSHLRSSLDYYLDNLKHWNIALAYDVQVMNAHSGEQTLSHWDVAWEQFFGGMEK
ncbi:accessory Sec system protein Asp1 [uncultured Limosilactobacillus sp.]|uniref:accessory Sec system protein Asp1 n=1 Tax=uncultured Limosilactobacillus sp. TaxID=2837629 RepID=UPI0025F912FE|nr:accessory Sec system protein Asp1 [uncultured Limosilactobacillus sp.]